MLTESFCSAIASIDQAHNCWSQGEFRWQTDFAVPTHLNILEQECLIGWLAFSVFVVFSNSFSWLSLSYVLSSWFHLMLQTLILLAKKLRLGWSSVVYMEPGWKSQSPLHLLFLPVPSARTASLRSPLWIQCAQATGSSHSTASIREESIVTHIK